MFQADCTTPFLFVSGDTILVKIGRAGGAPVLELSSAAATANGSVVTASAGSNSFTMTIQEADLSRRSDEIDTDINTGFTPGAYEIEVLYQDASDSDRLKHVDRGVFFVFDSAA